MTVPEIVEWLDDVAATDLIASGRLRNPKSLGYNSDVPTIFDGSKERLGWADYINAYPEEDRPYIEALRQVIVARNFRASKYWMDRGERWVPRFADGTVLNYTSDGWSELQAAIWSEEGRRSIFVPRLDVCTRRRGTGSQRLRGAYLQAQDIRAAL
jgi:hypothetical protein